MLGLWIEAKVKPRVLKNSPELKRLFKKRHKKQ